MGDHQFQQFIKAFESLPQHIRAPEQCYRLVPDIDIDCVESPDREIDNKAMDSMLNQNIVIGRDDSKKCVTERKRRKLPEIPINKKPLEGLWQVVSNGNGVPLCQELANPHLKYFSSQEKEKCLIRQVSVDMYLEIRTDATDGKPLSLKLYNRDPTLTTTMSPDEDDPNYRHGSDSGNSSAMSPTDDSSNFSHIMSARKRTEKLKSLQLLSATHRGLYKFIPRHKDEIEIEIGDPVYVSKENDDLWCEGINLRTGQTGIFPSALVTDTDYSEFVVGANDDLLPNISFTAKKERYLLDFLGSVEVMEHKGNAVLCESVRRVINALPSDIGMVTPQPSILEISDLGLRMTDRNPSIASNNKSKIPSHDYFFALKNVTFCGFYPKDHRFFAFITKHPTDSRLACHVFRGEESARDVAEAVGRAFHRFYNKFVELAYPIEEFYFD